MKIERKSRVRGKIVILEKKGKRRCYKNTEYGNTPEKL